MSFFSKLFRKGDKGNNEQVKVSIEIEITDHETRATACVQEMCEYIRSQMSASGALSGSEMDLVETEVVAFAAAFLNLQLEHHFFPNLANRHSDPRLGRLFKRSRMAVNSFCEKKYGLSEFSESYLAYRMHMAGTVDLDAISSLNHSKITAKSTTVDMNAVAKVLQAALDQIEVLIPNHFPEYKRG
jgi:hypothetical protein